MAGRRKQVESIQAQTARPFDWDEIGGKSAHHGVGKQRPALPVAEQALIYDWIMLGAPRISDTMFASGFEPRP